MKDDPAKPFMAAVGGESLPSATKAHEGKCSPLAAPRAPSPQERADDLLMRWRLARAAGVPPANRLEQEDRA